ncbi:class I SAM-dependent methyltransferase [Microvirga sp. BT689]|uniref:class I SAM-dependent methyltransferase n=1 Tax=Microvirga arvi TaxID=2778731 RepID=UPI00194ED99C|nr:class I SAM-dependent methyltransferase [Microvirga arvi]MBM6583766.1 class I SAM-dependent methyltransferase [Microvirga arvi]
MSSEFDASQAAHAYPKGIEHGFWSIARNRTIDSALEEAVRIGVRTSRGRILEIGCGPGIVVNALRAEGHDAWGVELGEPTVREAAKPYVTTGMAAQDLDAAFRASIETIMLLDVIEHIEDEVSFLQSILPAFPNCRSLIVTVPARPEVWSNYDEYYGHFRRYTRETLDAAIMRAGLIPERTRYFFKALYFAAKLINTFGRKRVVVLNSPRFLLLQRIIARGFDLENLLASSLPIPGLSLICIARRS